MDTANYPAEIEAAALELAQINQRIRDYQRAQIALDDSISFEVLFAVSPETNKPLFTNDAQRAIAIRDRQRNSEPYQTLQKNLDAAEMSRALATAKIERLRGEFATWKLLKRAEITERESD